MSCSFGNNKINASAAFPDESEMVQKLIGFADSLHFGSINAFGHWIWGSGALRREQERCAVIYAAPDSKDLMKELLFAFCGKCGLEGFIYVCDNKLYFAQIGGEERYIGVFDGALGQLEAKYAELYGLAGRRFEFSRFEDFRQFRSSCVSFADRAGLRSSANLLKKYGKDMFDYMNLPSARR